MKLSVWTYEGPPHVGAMRIATSMRGVHYVLHAPQGDTYADLLFTMIERRRGRPPVTYTTFEARDLGGDTAHLFKRACQDAVERFRPEALLVGASCTAELLQDDPGGLARTMDLGVPVIPLELPSYSKKENWGAAETFYRLVRACAGPGRGEGPRVFDGPSCNVLGPTALGFRSRDDAVEIVTLIESLGIAVNVLAPLDATPADLARLPDADFNVVLNPEIARTAADWLAREHAMAKVETVPIGVNATEAFVREIAELAGVDPAPGLAPRESRLPWYARSIDSNYLTGKRVFVFGDGSHALAAARIARDELGFEVCGLGTYSREMGRELRAAAKEYGLDPLVTDDHLEVEDAIREAAPELILGTQMERHVAKRMRVPCAVISAPAHVQDFPARYSPQMGYEGANVIFDTWVHPLMMGLEEHLLGMFREDFEFSDEAPSHLAAEAGHASHAAAPDVARPIAAEPIAAGSIAIEGSAVASDKAVADEAASESMTIGWAGDAERELRKIPFFVRGKARRNTEAFAAERGVPLITIETLYDAKAHYAR